jgi:alkaline phosphatase
MKWVLKIYLLIIIPGVLISCTENKATDKVVEGRPNVILLIGDGMGLSHVSSMFYYGKGNSNFTRFSEIGLFGTSSSRQEVTDSSAGATAFACGEKTYNGSVGLSTDSVPIPNLVEILSLKGYKTGVISTSSVTHATPAGFYAHVESRNMEEEIARQLLTSEIDFFAGGGMSFFSNRSDSINLIEQLKGNGFRINTEIKSVMPDMNNKYGFLLADDGMPTMLENRGEFLPDYTKYALDYFSRSEANFFLMVEGSQIDWAGHSNNADYLIAEMIDFDKTVGVALDYAKLKGNTLVIVLADHETGGFTLAAKDGDYSTIEPIFATTGHSSTLIPVFAYGPGAENYKGIYQNVDIFHKIVSITD